MKQGTSLHSHICENCEEKVPTHICTHVDCNQRLCLECSLIHPKIKQSRNHKVIELELLKENKKDNKKEEFDDDDDDIEDDTNYEEDIVEIDASNDHPISAMGCKNMTGKDSMETMKSSSSTSSSSSSSSSDLEDVDELLYNSCNSKQCTVCQRW